MSTALKNSEQQPSQLSREDFFTPEQQQMIRDSFLSGASESEAKVLLELARARRLNPITGQIHFVKRPKKEGERWIYVWAAQVGIDGFRAIAARTGKYEGQDEPEFEVDQAGRPRLCRVRVYRSDWSRPVVGVAHYAEFVQTMKDGSPNHMWKNKPHVMLAKCAEASALRKAFPDDIGGLYTPDEQPDQREDRDEGARSETELNEAPKAVAASNGRIADAVKRKTAANAVVEVAPVAPKPSPRRIEIKDVPPDEDDGYAESLAQMEVG